MFPKRHCQTRWWGRDESPGYQTLGALECNHNYSRAGPAVEMNEISEMLAGSQSARTGWCRGGGGRAGGGGTRHTNTNNLTSSPGRMWSLRSQYQCGRVRLYAVPYHGDSTFGAGRTLKWTLGACPFRLCHRCVCRVAVVSDIEGDDRHQGPKLKPSDSSYPSGQIRRHTWAA